MSSLAHHYEEGGWAMHIILFWLVIGIGIIVGSQIAGWASDWAGIGTDEADFTKLFEMPMYAALVCFVLLLLMYPSRSTKVEA